MAVTREDLLHVASLARLALDETSVPRLVSELNGILEHMEVLQKVDTSGVTPAEGVGDAGMPCVAVRPRGWTRLGAARVRRQQCCRLLVGRFGRPGRGSVAAGFARGAAG